MPASGPDSFATAYVQPKRAVLWKVGIVVEAKNFETIHRDVSLLQFIRGKFAPALKLRDRTGVHALDGHDGGVELAQIKRLAEREIVGEEKSAAAVGQHVIAEGVEYRHFHVGDRVDIAQPGGLLTVEWDGRGDVYLTGPAEFIFDGEWPE